jgi:adenosylcobinamide kinase/adenosylcobinamide-phosphate guanylyltransferase
MESSGKSLDTEVVAVAHVTFILGGCRSGKSGFALKTAEETAAARRVFIATSVPFDEEMQERVKRHRAERGAAWTTVEAPLTLPEAIVEHARENRVLLADCLTLWVSNLLLELQDPAQVEGRIPHLVNALRSAPGAILLVSNEVGCGVVPENRLARRFRDLSGSANQAVAAAAERVVWVVAGIPVHIK